MSAVDTTLPPVIQERISRLLTDILDWHNSFAEMDISRRYERLQATFGEITADDDDDESWKRPYLESGLGACHALLGDVCRWIEDATGCSYSGPGLAHDRLTLPHAATFRERVVLGLIRDGELPETGLPS